MQGYRLFSWELSYFSAKSRAYLRWKEAMGGLPEGFEDVLATNDLLAGLLLPATGTMAVPQLQTPDGRFVQDSSEIIDVVEAAHPTPPVAPAAASNPRQALTAWLIELLADEWMLPLGFWERWRHTLPDVEPNHARYNALQWGSSDAHATNAEERLAAGENLFELLFGLSHARTKPVAVYAGARALGVTPETEAAWDLSMVRMLDILNTHFGKHDFCFGGQPTLADFALMAPLYPHLYRDPVPGFFLRREFPFLADWVDRTNGTNALGARTYNQTIYSVGAGGELVGRPATSDGGALLPDDTVPETLLPLLGVFFEEMWPVLESAMRTLTAFLASDAHAAGGEVPGKSFTATPGFEALQTGNGPLTHAFQLGGVAARRMVVPYQIWMLGRLLPILAQCRASEGGATAIENLLAPFPGAERFLELERALRGCRLRKEGGLLYSIDPAEK
ncbi:MAG: glutathione S-transferase family protein [Deltaproteobacteria bacterium]